MEAMSDPKTRYVRDGAEKSHSNMNASQNPEAHSSGILMSPLHLQHKVTFTFGRKYCRSDERCREDPIRGSLISSLVDIKLNGMRIRCRCHHWRNRLLAENFHALTNMTCKTNAVTK